jgi:hypothetical protein
MIGVRFMAAARVLDKQTLHPISGSVPRNGHAAWTDAGWLRSALLKVIVGWDVIVRNRTWWNLDVWFGDVDLRAQFWQY